MKRRRGYPARPFLLTNPNSLLSTKRPNNLAGVQRPTTNLPASRGRKNILLVCLFYNKDGLGRRAKQGYSHQRHGWRGTRNWDGFGGALALVLFFSPFRFPSSLFVQTGKDYNDDGRVHFNSTFPPFLGHGSERYAFSFLSLSYLPFLHHHITRLAGRGGTVRGRRRTGRGWLLFYQTERGNGMDGWVVGARNGMDRLRFCFLPCFVFPFPVLSPCFEHVCIYVCVCLWGCVGVSCVGIFYRVALMRDGRTDGRTCGLAGGGLW